MLYYSLSIFVYINNRFNVCFCCCCCCEFCFSKKVIIPAPFIARPILTVGFASGAINFARSYSIVCILLSFGPISLSLRSYTNILFASHVVGIRGAVWINYAWLRDLNICTRTCVRHECMGSLVATMCPLIHCTCSKHSVCDCCPFCWWRGRMVEEWDVRYILA